jgi:hypothetical protein
MFCVGINNLFLKDGSSGLSDVMFGLMNVSFIHKQMLTSWFLFNGISLIGGKRRGPLGNALKENIKELPCGQILFF